MKASKIRKRIKAIAGIALLILCIAPACYATFEYLPDLMVDNNSVDTYYYNNKTYYYYTPSSRFINGEPASLNNNAVYANRFVNVNNYYPKTSARGNNYSGYNTANRDGYLFQNHVSRLRDPRNYYMYDEAKEQAGLYGN